MAQEHEYSQSRKGERDFNKKKTSNDNLFLTNFTKNCEAKIMEAARCDKGTNSHGRWLFVPRRRFGQRRS